MNTSESDLDKLLIANKIIANKSSENERHLAALMVAETALKFQNEEEIKWKSELRTANVELASQKNETENRTAELAIAKNDLISAQKEKLKRTNELQIAHTKLAAQDKERGEWEAELDISAKELTQSEQLRLYNLQKISDYKYALDESSIVAIVDQKGIIKNVNSNFCKISKYSQEELIGQDHRIINSGHHSKEFIRNLWVTIASGKTWKGEIKNKAKDGVFYWVDTTIVPFLNLQGKPYQYMAIRIDITDRKEAEESLILRTDELANANKELALQNKEKENRAAELAIANTELIFQNEEKEHRASELNIANKELAFQNKEKGKRAAELDIANKELIFQNEEKEHRASELIIANKELAFQNKEKGKRAAELDIANKELIFQNEEKEHRASELIIANKELAFQNDEKGKRAAELAIANTELIFQNEEKEHRASELIIANKELAFQNDEKGKRAAELVIANKELIFQNEEKENRASELIIANKELAFQNDEKGKRAAELAIANEELIFQNEEKENRASELIIANNELAFQNDEKGKRAGELIVANMELAFQNGEKERRSEDLNILSADLKVQQLELSRTNALLVVEEENVRKVNQQLMQLNQELEERVTVRTKALTESENKFRSMMETIPQIAWTNTIDGKITFYNQQWHDYTGLDYEQAKSYGPRSVLHPDDLKETLTHYQTIRESSTGGEFQTRIRRSDSSYRWHLIRLMPIINEDGQTQLLIGTATDIHELRVLQQQKDDFISIASHELKTPITTLKASLQVLNKMKNNPSPTMLPVLIEQANRSMDKVTLLVGDLLNASKVNEGHLEINPKPFVISRVIHDCCPHVNVEGLYDLKVEGDMDLEVFADPGRIDQIVINFVNNAIKYAPQSKEIRIKIEKLNNSAKVSVIDNGPGIHPEKLDYLFERYYRVNSTGSQYSGLGLGLYISSEIIKRHNGQIGVDSKLGEGSTFWFTLPLSQEICRND